MRVAIAGDHAGFTVKQELVGYLRQQGYCVEDLGAHLIDSDDDYPDFAREAARVIVSGRADRAIVVCGSGVGACVACNKVPGIRASVCHDTYSAHQGVEHDDMNVLCLGARIIGPELARELAVAFLSAKFTGEERHLRRLKKTLDIERANLR